MLDGDMAEADALARLETALDRIAQTAQRPAAAATTGPGAADIAGRLDALIAQLRDALAVEA